MKKTKVISILNFKGGVAKTTTTVNLGMALWILGKHVLLIDTDAQCNLSGLIGFNQTEGDNTLYEWLVGESVEMPIYERYPGLYYVPASKRLKSVESYLMDKRAGEMVLNKKLSPYLREREDGNTLFDYVLIDCSPKEGIVNDNAMCASSDIIIPAECSSFSLQGMKNLLLSIKDVKSDLNDGLDILGFLLVKYDKNTRISKSVTEFFEKEYADKVLKTRIRRNVTFDETPLQNMSIFEYNSEANGAEDYMSLAEEISGCKRPDIWKEIAISQWNKTHLED